MATERPGTASPIPKLKVMDRQWTGGQYSLFRVLLGAYVMAHMAVAVWPDGTSPWADLTGLGTVGSVLLSTVLALLLAAGLADRLAALFLTIIHGWLHMGAIIALMPGEMVITFLLLAHTAMPKAPYGSLQAMGRSDPDNGWRMPAWTALAIWIATMATLVFSLITGLTSSGWLAAGLVLLVFWLGRQQLAIVVLAAALLIAIMLFGTLPGPFLPLFLLLFLAFDPAWIKAGRRPATGILFFDGNCALCHGAVRFLLAEDRDERFIFSPIGGERFTRTLPKDAVTSLPDSMILVTDEREILLKSDAVIACLHGLGGLWRCAAAFLALLPTIVRDRLYDLIGSRRYKLFGTKAETCPLMTAAQRQRFHP